MSLLWLSLTPTLAADIEVELHEVKPQRGVIRVALFDNESDFSLDIAGRAMIGPDGKLITGVFTRDEHFPKAPLQTAVLTPTAATIVVRFSNLPPAEYAVAAYQDLNSNDRVDMNISGLALEPWGASNNPHPSTVRPPTWGESKFKLGDEGVRLTIELHQP